MSILKYFNSFESKIYDNEKECLDAMNHWDVAWQEFKFSERFHIKKNHGKFDGDYFFNLVRDCRDLLGGKIGYEGIELYAMNGAGTTHNCRAHSAMAKKERKVEKSDIREFYSCEIRVDCGETDGHNDYMWIESIDYGKRIKFQCALTRDQGNKILDRYYKKKDGYSLGDGFRR